MNTERRKRGRGIWAMPVLLAIPFLAAAAYVVLRYGPVLLRIVSAAVKTVVVV